MEFEFDKEIDALLRQTAQGETVFKIQNPKSKIQNPKSQHLDADEISAFAENALPERAKQLSMRHLADCETCRKALSNLITLNADAESETVHAAEKQSVALPIPWYRKLFALPNLAYTMGALVLVFSGIVGYTVLQNVSNSRSAEVSQISERQPNGKGMNSDGDAAAVEQSSSNMASLNTMMSNANMMSNSASMNSSSNTSAIFSNPVMTSAPTKAMNSNAAVTMREDSDKILRDESKSLVPQEEPASLAKTQDSTAAGAPAPAKSPAKENDFQSDGEAQRQQPSQTQNSTAQNQTNITPDSRNVQRPPMPTGLSAKEKSKKLEDSKNEREKSGKTNSVGGKTFKRENNVWYDSAYRGQPTTNVTRGTSEYKKLDSGLRGIAENLGGTVVVVWKEKAYRIQ